MSLGQSPSLSAEIRPTINSPVLPITLSPTAPSIRNPLNQMNQGNQHRDLDQWPYCRSQCLVAFRTKRCYGDRNHELEVVASRHDALRIDCNETGTIFAVAAG